MDHVIDDINSYFEIEYQELVTEWKSKQYKKMSDCPSWGSSKALVDAIHVLERHYYGEAKTMNLSSMLSSDLS